MLMMLLETAEWHNLLHVRTHPHDRDDNNAFRRARMSGSVSPLTNIDTTSITETDGKPEPANVLTTKDTSRPQEAATYAFITNVYLGVYRMHIHAIIRAIIHAQLVTSHYHLKKVFAAVCPPRGPSTIPALLACAKTRIK